MTLEHQRQPQAPCGDGASPLGILTYDATGHMAVQIMKVRP
jgi:Lipocalin-like domain